MNNKIFGTRIRKLRSDLKLSMEGLAKELNTNKSTVSMWENSGVVPREEMLIKISKLFNVSIDYLLGNEKREGKIPSSKKLSYIQRNLEKMDEERLEKAESILKTVFEDIFNDDEGEDEDDF